MEDPRIDFERIAPNAFKATVDGETITFIPDKTGLEAEYIVDAIMTIMEN
jgi:hypothetical protein